jgi:hypothetical protein
MRVLSGSIGGKLSMQKLLLALVCLLGAIVARPAGAAEIPGPSQSLFNHPYYVCLRNFYVSTTGSDTAAGTTPDTAWATLQHANDVGRTAGDCVNVEPGTYAHGVLINSGGNLASSTGYVVYRCVEMDECTVTDVNAGGDNGSFVWNTSKQPMPGNYIIIDGFRMAAASETEYGQGINLWNGTNTYIPSVHHVWIMNSIISGYGQAGVNMGMGEYFYVIHNKSYANAHVGCSAQGSGIAFVVLRPVVTDYTPTHDDLKNPIVGKIGTAFHNAIEWNVVYNNAITKCGTAKNPYDTDGNNIIIDTLSWTGTSGASPYTGGVLVAFNVTYNAGGGGVHIFRSEYVTAANNTCYNNYLDPYDQTPGACIDTNGSYSDTIINNIAISFPAAPNGSCAYYTAPYGQWRSATLGSPPSGKAADVYSHNISQLQGGHNSCWGAFGNDAPTGENVTFGADSPYSCKENKCATNPEWENVGTTSIGTETAPPVGTNFALKPGSPAIGYGLTETYLPASSVDVGACSSTLTKCP